MCTPHTHLATVLIVSQVLMTDFTMREAGPLKVLILYMSRLEPNEVRVFLLPACTWHGCLFISYDSSASRDEKRRRHLTFVTKSPHNMAFCKYICLTVYNSLWGREVPWRTAFFPSHDHPHSVSFPPCWRCGLTLPCRALSARITGTLNQWAGIILLP